MKLRPADGIVIAAAIGVITIIALLPSPRDNNPPIPTTPVHQAWTSEKDCLACHAPGQPQAVSARHPKRDRCFQCHRQ